MTKDDLIMTFLEGQNDQENKKSWLNNISSSLRKKLGNLKVEPEDANFKAFQFYKKFFSDKDFDVIEFIAQLLKEGDVLYAISCLDLTIQLYIIAEQMESSRSGINHKRQILIKLRDFIANREEHGIKVKDSSLNELRNRIPKSSLAKIDGSQALMHQIGEENFIRYAIEQSYFFAPDLVWERRDVMIKAENLPARKTTKEDDDVGTYSQQGSEFVDEQGKRYAITLDADGNKEVRALIKSLTGFTVCEGTESVFQNYTISHIWGRALDPRYFTSLWNIVLVPTWANGLLDKNSGALVAKLKAVFMSICRDLYEMESPEWGNFWSTYFMKCPAIESDEDFKCPEYRLNVIQRRPEKIDKNGQNTQYQSLVAPIIKVKYPLSKIRKTK